MPTTTRALLALTVATLAATALTAGGAAHAQGVTKEECTTVKGVGYGITQKSAETAARKDAYAQAYAFYAGHSLRRESDFKSDCGAGLVVQGCSHTMLACKLPRTKKRR